MHKELIERQQQILRQQIKLLEDEYRKKAQPLLDRLARLYVCNTPAMVVIPGRVDLIDLEILNPSDIYEEEK